MAGPNTRAFRHRRGSLELGAHTHLMGIVNVTPDSFSDGGKFLQAEAAFQHALRLAAEGARIIDLGAESTRPGSLGTSDEIQLERLLPVLDLLHGQTNSIISIDTKSAKVARECLVAGADMINDVSGLAEDDAIAEVCAEFGAGLVLMHMRGQPQNMQSDLSYQDVLGEVREFLADAVERAVSRGVARESILVDPGLGFGKSFEQNHLLLGNLGDLQLLAAGVLIGPSRKAFTGEFSNRAPDKRQFSTAAAVAIAALHGADVIRVHDVAEMREVVQLCDRFMDVNDVRPD